MARPHQPAWTLATHPKQAVVDVARVVAIR